MGAGFAGLNAVHALRTTNAEVTIVDRNNFHTFQPLLYQVSTGYLGPDEVGVTVRSVFRQQRRVTVRVGTVIGVDWSTCRLQLEDGAELPFDYLVVAVGATTHYFDIPGMQENSWPLYTLGDAVRLRSHLLAELERAAGDPDPNAQPATVAVVGGGPTGVEMAGALATMGRDLIGGDVGMRVVLIEALPRLLNGFSDKSGRRALNDLRSRHVDVRLGTSVKSANADSLTLETGESIPTHTIVWAAGVRSNPLGEQLGLTTGKGGGVVVGSDLQVRDRPRVFAVGDAALISPVGSRQPLPRLGPVAIQSGKHAGRQIARLIAGRPTTPFKYFDKGVMAVLGRGNAVAEVPWPGKGVAVGGRLAWLLWLGVHIVYLVGFRNRLKVLVDWGWNYLTARGAGAILVHQGRPSGGSTGLAPRGRTHRR